MNLKYLISILVLVSVISTASFSQKKRKVVKEIKADTVYVFDQLEEEFISEKNVYWPEKGEMTLLYRKIIRDTANWDGGELLYFSVVFENWDSVQIGHTYNLEEMFTDCEIKEVFGGYNFETPTGKVLFKGKIYNRLTFQFDAQALSKDKSKLLIFEGVREFVPDY